MSSDFYFRRWKTTLEKLEELVKVDVEYQITKTHDKTLCEAMLRWTAVLGRYTSVYNDAVECQGQNLQMQKTPYIQQVVDAMVGRIMELNRDISKLVGSEHIFMNNGLVFNKNTSFDVELIEIPDKAKRSKEMADIIEVATEKALERIKLEEKELTAQEQPETVCWWDNDYNDDDDMETDTMPDIFAEKKKVLTPEEEEIKRNILIIQAQERARTVVTEMIHHKLRRQRWEMELKGTAAPKPSADLSERSAKIIQKVFRAYFDCKRKRVIDAKKDELLGIQFIVKPKNEAQIKAEQIKTRRTPLREQFEQNLKSEYEIVKEKYLKLRKDDICEVYRDYIRDWFYMWFDKIKVFYNIPGDSLGGSKLILREEIPTPDEYLEQYKAYLAEKKANKGKSSQQKKMAKLEAKREELMAKKFEKEKERQQNKLKRKLLKNPNQHPGYHFPESKKTEHLLTVIQDYHSNWDDYDETEIAEVKEKHCSDFVRKNVYAEVKMELIPQVDAQMRMELEKLKKALKKDYANNDLEYPEPIKSKCRKKRKAQYDKIKQQNFITEDLVQKMEELVFLGIVKGYPRTKLQDFIGDPNFYGDEVRCNYGSSEPCHGDTRRLWWDNCRRMSHEFNKTLLVGPRGCGKTVLIHALASLNDAILFELDASQIQPEHRSDKVLRRLVASVVTCARAAQPAVIHIKHVHRLYYKKIPQDAKGQNYPLFKKNFTKKLWKNIQKSDKITIIGSCVDPWLTKSSRIIKDFPDVVLMPNTNYSIVVEMLNDWVLSNYVVPADLNVSSLAQVLQGYSYGCLKEFLGRFLTGERIASISARGLHPKDLLESLLDENVEKPDYALYLQWYRHWTRWGRKEQAHLLEQREFKQALDRWALKREKEKEKMKREEESE